ncbi:acyl-CoA dehydrogenase family protein [Cupriavidus gilardii]|uniref:acyl-CoA dehydrogenase family protein n=1 Tax=Cupriavidus gilardii TaxID=82541 RepID=UPI0021BE95C7|nr:acyl-CoA dehydrogenase family protein [Cupriavidus gilardii]MCT9124396.1 acyl-CoA dehydrogenase family protein [Cupriavidus gilardii]
MQLTLNEQQRLIEESALNFLSRQPEVTGPWYEAGPEAGPEPGPESRPESRHNLRWMPMWRAFAEMGWLGLPLPAQAGGFDGGAVETGLLMRAFGRYGVNMPYHGGILLAARMLAAIGTPAQRDRWLPAVIDGSRRLTLAHDEPQCHDPWAPRATVARREGSRWRLQGAKLLVPDADGADALLVSARIESEGRAPKPDAHAERDGQALFLVPMRDSVAEGLRLHRCHTVDGTAAADVWLDGAHVEADAMLGAGDGGDAAPVLHRLLAEGAIALCWEACGAMQAAFERTAAYVRQREQFGRPLASFQSVQHTLAEMAVCCEEAIAACELAALRVDAGLRDATDAVALAAMAKSKVGRAARYVSQQAVQLHGGMGVSEELPIAGLFRKLTRFQQQDGSPSWHAARYGRAMLASGTWRDSRTLPSSNRSCAEATTTWICN